MSRHSQRSPARGWSRNKTTLMKTSHAARTNCKRRKHEPRTVFAERRDITGAPRRIIKKFILRARV